MENSEEKIIENEKKEFENLKMPHHGHCGNNNVLCIIAIVLSIISIALSSYTLGAMSKNNNKGENVAIKFNRNMATPSNMMGCPMFGNCFNGNARNDGKRRMRQQKYPVFNGFKNFSYGNNSDDKNDNYRNQNNFPKWGGFNSNFMNNWEDRNFNNSNLRDESDGLSRDFDKTDRGFNRGRNWWNNNDNNDGNRRNRDNKKENTIPGSLPNIGKNDQAPNFKDDDVKEPLPIPPKVEVR